MGDVRFAKHYRRVRDAPDPKAELARLDEEALIAALAATARERDAYLANVIATELLNRTRQASAITQALGEGVLATDGEGRILYLNPSAERVLGWPLETIRMQPFEMLLGPTEDGGRVRDAIRAHRETREEAWLRRSDDRIFAAEVTTTPVIRMDEAVGTVVVFRDVTDKRRAEAERASLLARERAARERAEGAERRASFLARATQLLATSLDESPRLERLADLVVPELADWCAIHLLDEQGDLRLRALAHKDPARLALAREYVERYPVSEHSVLHEVIRTGEGRTVSAIDAEARPLDPGDAAQREMLRRLELHAMMCVPLDIDGRVGGVLTLVSSRTDKKYDADDLTLAHDLARAATLALDNARLYEREREARRAAETAARALNDALREARETRRRYETLVQASSQIVWTTDGQGYAKGPNDSWRAVTGQSPEEMAGHGWMDAVHPEDRRRAERGWARALRTLAPFELELRLRTRDGGYRWFADYGVPVLDDEGRLREWVGAMVDITERREAERALRETERELTSILESITDAFFALDEDWRFTYVNREAERLLQQPRERLLGRTMWEALPASVGSRFEENYRRAIETREAVHFEAVYPPLDAWLEVNAYPRAGGLSVYFRDITERKRMEGDSERLRAHLEERVRERTHELEAANQELEAFSHTVSHDLRAPLRGIDFFAQVLEEDHAADLDDEGQALLKRLRAESRRASQLVQDLLRLSRASREPVHRQPFDLSLVAREVVEDLRRAAPEREVDVRVEPDLAADGDPGLVRIVLENLLGNAWKFTSKTPDARIEVAKEGEWFVVRDNGAGFDPEKAERLFRPFQRLHTAQQFEGTGLGLAAVARIARRHGGDVEAEGAPGQGATFRFRLS